MLAKPPECTLCRGFDWNHGQGFSRPEGTAVRGVALVGEALGENEANDGLPFRPYAQAGAILQRVLSGWHGAGFPREQFLIFNTIQCRPPGNVLEGASYQADVIASCKVHRDRIIAAGRPKVIVALGGAAFRTLTGFEDIHLNRGYPVWNDEYEAWVIGSFHPAFLARGQRNLMGVLREDIKKAVWLAGQPGWLPQEVSYTLQPSLEQAKAFLREVRANPRTPLAVDIENPLIRNEEEDEEGSKRDRHLESPIMQIQFSLQPGTGIVFPWIEGFRDIAKQVLGTPNPKWGHNSRKYDFPILSRNGFPPAGEWHDTMDAFRMVQSNVNGCYHLQGVASFFGGDQLWKHRMGEDMEFYGAMDVDAPQRIIQGIIPTMQRLGVWETYMKHVVEMEPVLVGMTRRGLARDEEMIATLKAETEAEMTRIEAEIAKLIPVECLKFKDFKKLPKAVKEIKLALGGMRADPVEVERLAAELGYEFVRSPHGAMWWRRWEPFSPSNQQLQGYCKFRSYRIPKHPKEDKPTMNEWALRGLLKETKDPVFELSLQYRDAQKISGTYLGGAWEPAADGKTHGTFYSARTASGQFSSRDPNSQQIPR
jgi:uracil-DNA glycosylase family 4